MASPVDSARVGTSTSTANTTHAVNVGSPANGDFQVVAARFNGDPGTVTFTGYTALVSADNADASDDASYIFYRASDGSEGATDTLTTVNSVKAAFVAWVITGADTSIVPDISTVAITAAANGCNPTSVSGTGGSKDYLFLAIMTMDGEATDPTAEPTNYTNLVSANSGTAASTLSNTIVGGATRQLTAASDDPGAFTHGAPASGGSAWVLAIHPAPAGGGGGTGIYWVKTL